MEQQFYTILTKVGKAKIANSNVLNTKLNLTKFQVGDGGGAYYNPTEDQTKLKNKVWEGNINSIRVDKDNPSWIVIEVVIPSNEGGFMIREAGIQDDEGNLIAVGKYPETFKPHIDNGSSKDLFIRMILEVSNTQNVTLKVDPTIIMATKKDIEVLESRVKGLEDRVSEIETGMEDNTLTVFKTDALSTTLDGGVGGFVNIEEIKGKTLVNLYDKKSNGNYKSDRDEFESSNEYLCFNIVDVVKYKLNSTRFTVVCDLKTTKDGNVSCYSLGKYGIENVKYSAANSVVKCTSAYQRVAFSFNVKYDKDAPNGDNCNISFYGVYGTGIKPIIKNFMLLEGDCLDNIPGYFEGIQSVGEPVILNANLFNSSCVITGQLYDSNGTAYGEPISSLSTQYIGVNSNRDYYSSKPVMILTYDDNKKFIERLYGGGYETTHRFKPNVSYVRLCQFKRGVDYLNDLKLSELEYKVEILSKNSNLFDLNRIGAYIGGNVINISSGIFNINGTKVSVLDNPHDLIGIKIGNIKKDKVVISGITNLRELNCYYRFLNKSQESTSIAVVNGKFRFEVSVPDGETELFLGIGNYPYVGTYYLENICITDGEFISNYEPSRQDKIEIFSHNPLRKISNTIHDNININGIITRNCYQVTLNGSEDILYPQPFNNTIRFAFRIPILSKAYNAISDKFPLVADYSKDIEHFYNESDYIYLFINKSRLATQDVAGVKAWLSQNPVTVIYQLATPTTENTNKTLSLRGYQDGSLVVNSGSVNPTLTYSYAKNTGERFVSIENSVENIIDKVDKLDEYEEYTLTPLNGYIANPNAWNKVERYNNIVSLSISVDFTNVPFPLSNMTPLLILHDRFKPRINRYDLFAVTDKGAMSISVKSNGHVIPNNLTTSTKPNWMYAVVTYVI